MRPSIAQLSLNNNPDLTTAMKRRLSLLLALAFLVFGIAMALLDLRAERPRQLTFAQCEQAGGTAWRVDLYDPEICPDCAALAACEAQHSDRQAYPDLREVCPQMSACADCMEANFPYPKACPGGMEKLGEISDAAIWFLCCR